LAEVVEDEAIAAGYNLGTTGSVFLGRGRNRKSRGSSFLPVVASTCTVITTEGS